MRVVPDTNVLVSGLLSPHGRPGTVVDLVASGAHRVCLNGRILAEYREVLARPRLALPPESVETVLAVLVRNGLRPATTPLRTKLPIHTACGEWPAGALGGNFLQVFGQVWA